LRFLNPVEGFESQAGTDTEGCAGFQEIYQGDNNEI
jgi:hypothetical protein